MEFVRLTVSIIILSMFLKIAHAQSVAAMILEKTEPCGDAASNITLFINPKNFNRGHQTLDINFTVPYPLGNDFAVKVKIEKESPVAKNSWLPLFSFEDKGMCHAFEKYMGEFVFDMETAMGIPRKSCPLPKGIYHANNYVMNFNNLRLQMFPPGKTRVIIALHKPRNHMVSCYMHTLSNTA